MKLLKAVGRFLSPAFEVFKMVNNTILLSFLFYFLLSPVALLRRVIFGARLAKKIDKSAYSYFEDPQKMSDRLENPY